MWQYLSQILYFGSSHSFGMRAICVLETDCSDLVVLQIEEPYLAIEEATTYELSACYNVSIDCHSGDMVANILTSTLFDGKIYAKGSPETCMEDINGQLKFSITFGYNDIDCGVKRETPGSYTNDVIIQHHDRIVTSSDLGLSVTCQYDLTNKTVSNKVDLQITGEIAPSLYEESLVDSPNVIMRVADDQGQDTKTAVVGDPLSMVFEILDQVSHIFDSSKVVNSCPTCGNLQN